MKSVSCSRELIISQTQQSGIRGKIKFRFPYGAICRRFKGHALFDGQVDQRAHLRIEPGFAQNGSTSQFPEGNTRVIKRDTGCRIEIA